jgi:hypothetical protein
VLNSHNAVQFELYKPASISHYAFLVCTEERTLQRGNLDHFISVMQREYNRVGLAMPEFPETIQYTGDLGPYPDQRDLQKQLDSLLRNCRGGDPEVIFFIMRTKGAPPSCPRSSCRCNTVFCADHMLPMWPGLER